MFSAGTNFPVMGPGDLSDYENVFRPDARVLASSGSPAIFPWNMHETCFEGNRDNQNLIRKGYRHSSPEDVWDANFASLIGDDIDIFDLDDAIMRGRNKMNYYGFPHAAGDAMLFYSMRSAAVNKIWENVFNESLTIQTRYPRNPQQREVLMYLVHEHFKEQWSLKDLLADILLSNYFNRKSPKYSPNAEPYRIPKVFDPWIELDPREPPDPSDPPGPHHSNNSAGDIVHRHLPTTLFNSVARALDWPKLRLRPLRNPFPNRELASEVGQFISDFEPGTRSVDFQALLAWESEVASCRRPFGTANDWMDELVAGIDNFNLRHPDDLTLLELILTIKDWLITRPTIYGNQPQAGSDGLQPPSEMAGLNAFFADFFQPGESLHAPVRPFLIRPGFMERLREYCGILLKSPQFMLAGLDASERTHTPMPRYRLCNDPDCSYEQICRRYRAYFEDWGVYVNCFEDYVDHGTPPITIGPEVLVEFCPHDKCGFALDRDFIGCLVDAGFHDVEACIRPSIPTCDPLCLSQFGGDCCGGPRPLDLSVPSDILIYAEGARILEAQDILIQRLGRPGFETLRPGSILRFGDLLVVPPGAKFQAAGALGTFGSLERTMPARTDLYLRKLDRELFSAARAGNVTVTQSLLKSGARLDARDAWGRTALSYAAQGGHAEVAKVLIEREANVNLKDMRGLNPVSLCQGKRQSRPLFLVAWLATACRAAKRRRSALG